MHKRLKQSNLTDIKWPRDWYSVKQSSNTNNLFIYSFINKYSNRMKRRKLFTWKERQVFFSWTKPGLVAVLLLNYVFQQKMVNSFDLLPINSLQAKGILQSSFVQSYWLLCNWIVLTNQFDPYMRPGQVSGPRNSSQFPDLPNWNLTISRILASSQGKLFWGGVLTLLQRIQTAYSKPHRQCNI